MGEESNTQVEGGVATCGTSPEDVQGVSQVFDSSAGGEAGVGGA